MEKHGTKLGELQQGSAFGERAVLGLTSIQSFTIKVVLGSLLRVRRGHITSLDEVSEGFSQSKWIRLNMGNAGLMLRN